MSTAEDLGSHMTGDAASVIARYLETGDDVTRCAAVRALGSVGGAEAAPYLIGALLDEDPDVRTDAMAELVKCARPGDADAIRRSLMGDPVREVKVAAVAALASLSDTASVPLFRSLVVDRCEHDVAWEDETDVWDDWLDVQIAVVDALGNMGLQDAVKDLLAAHDDEFGQDLDHPVFAALAKIPDEGVAALLGFVRDENASVRSRALSALTRVAPEHLSSVLEDLLCDPSAEVRQLAMKSLEPGDPAVADLCMKDPDASVRSTALAHCAQARPDLVATALSDESEEVRVLALELLVATGAATGMPDLGANVQAWLQTAGPNLAAVCAGVLPALDPEGAGAVLEQTALDTARPAEVRVAAVRALASGCSGDVVSVLSDLACNPTRQIRIAALTGLADVAAIPDDEHCAEAESALASAMRGDMNAPDTQTMPADETEPGPLVASKVEDGGGRKIRISRDGEILTEDDVPPEQDGEEEAEDAFPTSTLAAIQAPVRDVPQAETEPFSEDELAHLAASQHDIHKKRVPVDGPEDFADDLRVCALRAAATCEGEAIDEALADALEAADPVVRSCAFETVALRAETVVLTSDLAVAMGEALNMKDALLRGHAARAVMLGTSDAAEVLRPLLDDVDPMVRSMALEAVGPGEPDLAVSALLDTSALVNRSALNCLLHAADPQRLEAAVDNCLSGSRADVLSEACKQDETVRSIVLATLGNEDVQPRRALTALQALSSA